MFFFLSCEQQRRLDLLKLLGTPGVRTRQPHLFPLTTNKTLVKAWRYHSEILPKSYQLFLKAKNNDNLKFTKFNSDVMTLLLLITLDEIYWEELTHTQKNKQLMSRSKPATADRTNTMLILEEERIGFNPWVEARTLLGYGQQGWTFVAYSAWQ